ncbi:hypothetical protein [Desulfurispira natronophila]|uniref:Peptidase C39 domain-containing protein n=1 Tax=Desulfurispira natronophila TaxID=682562 RepID=A0A7W8DFQ6_9BACT|nr:hypothetical protein [Desulfurispira natronophila]MBB5020701.1 hypothetical protein [Desulfurispira natronophila]
MDVVVQEKVTGCGIAAFAALADLSYAEAQMKASALGIHTSDASLWSDTEYVRTLLQESGISVSPNETPFKSWEELPDKALLAGKWHIEQGKPFWHWVLFVRENGKTKILDFKRALKSNVRVDFGRIKPNWYIEILNIQSVKLFADDDRRCTSVYSSLIRS